MALTDNILGYWKLDGDSTDATGNGNNGTDTSISYAVANGIINQGALFNGTSSVISVGSGLSVSGGAGLTIAGWVNISSATGSLHEFFVKRDGTNGCQYQFGIINGTGNLFYFDGATLYNSGVAMTYGSWVHVAMTLSAVSSGTLNIYVNGTSIYNTTGVSIGSGASAACYLGNQFPTNNEAQNGSVDEWGVWSRGLSGAEITQLVNGGVGLQYPFASSSSPVFIPGLLLSNVG